MIIELQRMLQGIVETLDEEVGPCVTGGHARAQFYSSLDLLNNLSSKLDWSQPLLRTEIEGVEAALGAAQPSIEQVRGETALLGKAADAITGLLASPTGESDDLVARVHACNQVLEDAIAAINDPKADFSDATEEVLTKARESIHDHLRDQAIREAFYIKPMMLTKISQGD